VVVYKRELKPKSGAAGVGRTESRVEDVLVPLTVFSGERRETRVSGGGFAASCEVEVESVSLGLDDEGTEASYQSSMHVTLKQRDPCPAFVPRTDVDISLQFIQNTKLAIHPVRNVIRRQ
jgi:hypothetical protein